MNVKRLTIILWVRLTNTLKILVKDSKIEINDKFYVNKFFFCYFNVLNA